MKSLLLVLALVFVLMAVNAQALTTLDFYITDHDVGDYSQFSGDITYEDYLFQFRFDPDLGYSFTNADLNFKMSRYYAPDNVRTTFVFVGGSSVLTLSNSVIVPIPRTDVPSTARYYAEVWCVVSNEATSIARGTITTKRSLFDANPDTYAFPAITNDFYDLMQSFVANATTEMIRRGQTNWWLGSGSVTGNLAVLDDLTVGSTNAEYGSEVSIYGGLNVSGTTETHRISASIGRIHGLRSTTITSEYISMHSDLPNGEISFHRSNPFIPGILYLDGAAMLTASNYADYITDISGYLTEAALSNYYTKIQGDARYYTQASADALFLTKTYAASTYATAAEVSDIRDNMTSGMEYQGAWDASTSNTPAVASNGWYWVVETAGTITNVTPNLSCEIGDSLIYSGSEWDTIQRGGVLTIAGQAGHITTLPGTIITSIIDSAYLDEADPVFTARVSLAISDPDKVLTRSDGDSLYAATGDVVNIETDPVWTYEKDQYLCIADETADANGTQITNLHSIVMTGGAEISSTPSVPLDGMIVFSNGYIITPGTVLASVVEATTGNFENWSAYTNYMIGTNGLVTILQQNQEITQNNFSNVNYNSTVWSNALAIFGQMMEDAIPGLSNVQVNIDYALMDTNYAALPTNLGVTADSGVANWMTNVSMLVVTSFYDRYIMPDVTNLNQNFATINQNFGMISNDFVSLSNYLCNASNGVVTLLNSSQTITVSNFGKVNYNFQQFSNAIYNVATSLAAGIVGFGTPTVNIEYAQMDTTNYTELPTGIDITFPSTMGEAMTNIAETVSQQQIINNYNEINNYVTTNIFIAAPNYLDAASQWTTMELGYGSYINGECVQVSGDNTRWTVPCGSVDIFLGIDQVAYYKDITISPSVYKAGGLYFAQGSYVYSHPLDHPFFYALGFGGDDGSDFHMELTTQNRGSFSFFFVPQSNRLRFGAYPESSVYQGDGRHVEITLSWFRISLGN